MNKEVDLSGKGREIKSLSKTNNNQFYVSNSDYLNDELKWLNLLIRRYITENDLKGTEGIIELALSKEQIYNMLKISKDNNTNGVALSNQLKQLEKEIEDKSKTSLQKGIFLPLPFACQVFKLNSFERHCIILCLAPEIKSEYQSIYAYLQNDLNKQIPGIEMTLKLLFKSSENPISMCKALDRSSKLIKFFMDSENVTLNSNLPMISRSLKLDEWVVSFLLNFEVLDWRIMNSCEIFWKKELEKPEICSEIDDKLREFINQYWTNRSFGFIGEKKGIFYFHGPKGVGKKRGVKKVANGLGMGLIIADVEKLQNGEISFYEVLQLLLRQVVLQNTVLCLDKFEVLMTEEEENKRKLKLLFEMLSKYSTLTFLIGKDSWKQEVPEGKVTFVPVKFDFPDEMERRHLWEELRKDYLLSEKVNMEEFSKKFRFTSGDIRSALKLSENLAVWNSKGISEIGESELYASCYSQSNRELSSVARKVNALYSWDMLILPQNQKEQLIEVVNGIKYRNVVYEQWGFDKRLSLGKGINVLFSGPPGSGKTMAAEVIANELNLEIYRIDVSQLVSKYIGETEKNLAKVFQKGEASNAILFFDEADALFGKRTDVKDAHDRYANIEISYLLQRMEEYKGLVILATNLSQNMDEAFLRRLNFNILFPFPEKEQREEIWRGIFPKGAPLHKEIDYKFMAEKIVLSGGHIKNIALGAAYYAAEAGTEIGMKEIMMATRREYQKLQKSFLKSDFSPYYELIEVN